MERLQQLINQLQEQHDRKVDPSHMLQTIRLLEAELALLSTQAAVSKGSAKVAVMMPSSMKIYTGQDAMQEFRSSAPENRNETRNGSQNNGASVSGSPLNGSQGNGSQSNNGSQNSPYQVNGGASTDQEFIPAQKTAAELKTSSDEKAVSESGGNVKPAPESRPAPEGKWEPKPVPELRTPAEVRTATEGWAPVASDVKLAPARPATAIKEPERGPWPFDPLADIPTLSQQQGPRELNDVIGNNGSSLNDKLKVNVLELSAALNDTPVRDLKKAIGVNDRFVFISQLFRGDEVMYERSIKTINGFRILPEAEYWMERELKVKLGWDENREATKHFYQLVRRRFS